MITAAHINRYVQLPKGKKQPTKLKKKKNQTKKLKKKKTQNKQHSPKKPEQQQGHAPLSDSRVTTDFS